MSTIQWHTNPNERLDGFYLLMKRNKSNKPIFTIRHEFTNSPADRYDAWIEQYNIDADLKAEDIEWQQRRQPRSSGDYLIMTQSRDGYRRVSQGYYIHDESRWWLQDELVIAWADPKRHIRFADDMKDENMNKIIFEVKFFSNTQKFMAVADTWKDTASQREKLKKGFIKDNRAAADKMAEIINECIRNLANH